MKNEVRTLDPKEIKYTAHSIKQGQILTIDDTDYVVLTIGAQWVKRGRVEYMEGEQHAAVLARYDSPDTYINLKLYPYSGTEEVDEDAKVLPSFSEKDEIERWGREDISEEDKERLRNTPINITEYGDRTLLQNLLFSIHSHPPEGLGTIYHEIDLERVCDHMHKQIAEEIITAPKEKINFLLGMDQVFSEMKAFFIHAV